MKNIIIYMLVALVLVTGFSIVAIANYMTYSDVIEYREVNMSKLLALKIYGEIEHRLSNPIIVSSTMANNNFLKEWLINEKENGYNQDEVLKLQKYLYSIKTENNYNSIFMISSESKKYYHYRGLHKVIIDTNDHDQWYYKFLENNLKYELNLDTDEADNHKLTVFINVRIEDEDGNLLGVTGVGLDVNQIQELFEKVKQEYNVQVMLVDKSGIVKVNSKYGNENSSFELTEEMIDSKEEVLTIFDSKGASMDKKYVVSKYLDLLDWYLVVIEETPVIRTIFLKQIASNILIIVVVTMAMIVIVSNIIRKNNFKLEKLSKEDQLTGLLNRRGFDYYLNEALVNYRKNNQMYNLFIFDIDNFKLINDIHGHLYGDHVIEIIASIANGLIKDKGILARWGGDEFAGIIFLDIETGKKYVDELYELIRNDKELSKLDITISLGITESEYIDTRDSIVLRADKGLYKVKAEGKNDYCII